MHLIERQHDRSRDYYSRILSLSNLPVSPTISTIIIYLYLQSCFRLLCGCTSYQMNLLELAYLVHYMITSLELKQSLDLDFLALFDSVSLLDGRKAPTSASANMYSHIFLLHPGKYHHWQELRERVRVRSRQNSVEIGRNRQEINRSTVQQVSFEIMTAGGRYSETRTVPKLWVFTIYAWVFSKSDLIQLSLWIFIRSASHLLPTNYLGFPTDFYVNVNMHQSKTCTLSALSFRMCVYDSKEKLKN